MQYFCENPECENHKRVSDEEVRRGVMYVRRPDYVVDQIKRRELCIVPPGGGPPVSLFFCRTCARAASLVLSWGAAS